MSNAPTPDQTPDGPAFEGRLLDRPDDDVVDQGASFDMTTLVTRRRVLGLVGAGAGAIALAACSSDSADSSGSSAATSEATTSEGEIPQETNGPYPADGTNDVNVLEESGIVRSDITSSLDGDAVVEGVPMTLTFTLVDMAEDDAPFEGAALYAWQCDAQGRYSMYTEGVEDETWLRGIQVADADGKLTFETIVPGCYAGRWPHLHFEVYPDADSATDVENAIATSQLALPEEMLGDVYALDTYEGSSRNLSGVGSLEQDNVFSDGTDLQLATVSGDVDSGYIASLTVNVDTTTEPGAGGMGGGGEGGPGGGEGGQPPGEGEGAPGGGAPPSGEPPSGEPPSNQSDSDD